MCHCCLHTMALEKWLSSCERCRNLWPDVPPSDVTEREMMKLAASTLDLPFQAEVRAFEDDNLQNKQKKMLKFLLEMWAHKYIVACDNKKFGDFSLRKWKRQTLMVPSLSKPNGMVMVTKCPQLDRSQSLTTAIIRRTVTILQSKSNIRSSRNRDLWMLTIQEMKIL